MTAYEKLRTVDPLRLLSLLGAVLAGGVAVVVYLELTTFTLLAVGTSMGFLAYAVLGESGDGTDFGIESAPPDWLASALTVVFLLASAVSILSLRSAYYTKPLLFYVAVAVAAGALFVRVIATDAHGSNLALAILFGGITFASNQLAFPLGLNGPDVGVHVRLAETIATTGHVQQGTLYSGFPGQHILAATVAMFGGLPVRPTYRIVGLLGMLLGLPVVYLVARLLGDRRYAVLAVVLYAGMDYVVYRAGHPSKLAYTLPLILLLLATFAHVIDSDDRAVSRGFLWMFLLFGTALAFTHHYSVVVAVVMVGSLVVGGKLYDLVDGSSGRLLRRLAHHRPRLAVPSNDLLMLFGLAGVAALNLLVLSGFSNFIRTNIEPHVRRITGGIAALVGGLFSALPPLPSLPSIGGGGTTPSGGGSAGGGTPGSGGPTPGTSAPGTSAPGTSAPGTSAPGTSAPGTSAPGTPAPGGSPGGGTPGPGGPTTSAGGGGTPPPPGGGSSGGGESVGSIFADLTRFEQIPAIAAFVNTVGSGALVGVAVVGGLSFLRRRSALSTGLLVWSALAGVWMVSGLLLDVPFTLPQRLYAVLQITVLAFLGARGILVLLRRARGSTYARPATAAVVFLVMGLVFFSTTSVIAGMETSPFNDEVPHRTWYKMPEEEATKQMLDSAGVPQANVTFARSLSATDEGRLHYENATGTVIVLNGHKIQSGVLVEPGHGHVGTARWVFPEHPERGLENRTRLYDNGVMTVHENEQ